MARRAADPALHWGSSWFPGGSGGGVGGGDGGGGDDGEWRHVGGHVDTHGGSDGVGFDGSSSSNNSNIDVDGGGFNSIYIGYDGIGSDSGIIGVGGRRGGDRRRGTPGGVHGVGRARADG